MLAARFLCTNKKQLEVMMKGVIEEGGEGLVLNKRFSKYDNGRTPNLVKLKVLLTQTVDILT